MNEEGGAHAQGHHAQKGGAHAQEIVWPGPSPAGEQAPGDSPEAEQAEEKGEKLHDNLKGPDLGSARRKKQWQPFRGLLAQITPPKRR